MNALRVLIVDDSSVMRKIVDRSLRQAGMEIKEVFEASNGVEALARMQQTRVDLILSDINMPTMDGLELGAATSDGRERQRRAHRDGHDGGGGSSRGAGAFQRRARLHPQAL